MATGMERAEPPLVVIVGPTASGKTEVAIDLAEQLNGEIICADSRTIYKGMDIGTAKPTPEEQVRVPHWGLDLVEPNQKFSVADFKNYANKKIDDVRARGKIPFLVGGSGLYVDAVIFDYELKEEADTGLRADLEKLTLAELHQRAKELGVDLPENSKNKRYVVRAIERRGQNYGRRQAPDDTTIIVGIATDRATLRQRIAERSKRIFESGIVEETAYLSNKYDWNHESMTGNIYPIIKGVIEGGEGIKTAEDKFTTLDWRLAKRQLTWFRRNPYIMWLTRDDVTSYVRCLADI